MNKDNLDEQEELEILKKKIIIEKSKYELDRSKKYVTMSVCGTIGLILGALIPIAIHYANNAVMDRSGLDGLAK